MRRFLLEIKPTDLVKVSILSNLGLAIGKALIGILSLSFFLCVNALYNIGIAFAKYNILDGIEQGKDHRAQIEDSRKVGMILLIASAVYMLYSIRMFVSPPTTQYPMVVAIAIAAFTFTEIALNLKGVFSKKEGRTPLTQVTKLTSLASSLICLVLTQRAILSFTMAGENVSPANGLAGIVFGAIAALIGIYIVARADSLVKEVEEPSQTKQEAEEEQLDEPCQSRF